MAGVTGCPCVRELLPPLVGRLRGRRRRRPRGGPPGGGGGGGGGRAGGGPAVAACGGKPRRRAWRHVRLPTTPAGTRVDLGRQAIHPQASPSTAARCSRGGRGAAGWARNV